MIASAAVLALFVSLLPAVAAANPEPGNAPAPVEPTVVDQIDTEGQADFWVVFRDRADVSAAHSMRDWDARGRYVYHQLTTTARASQAGVTAELSARGVDHDTFSIVNAILVRSAGRATLDWTRNQSEVERIDARWSAEIPEPAPGEEEARIQALEWNIERIRADEVWDSFGVRGEGATIGIIDTGTQYDHPALVQQYRGNLGGGDFDHNHSWWDPGGDQCADAPCDGNGHGTHVMGTAVGDDGDANQIGVAPGARWISALGCPFGGCPDFDLLESGEFMLAPWDLDQQNPDPDLRPHVVNNSWGTPAGGNEFYREMVQAWVAAGIFPAFANGNSGPGCGTVGAPASYPESYGVGASDINDNIAAFSSRGPSPIDGGVKPQTTAPGANIRSSLPGGNYGNLSGTSMASPHVAGAVGLLVSAAPGLAGDLDELHRLLGDGAVPMEDLTCGGDPEYNNVWGRGLIDTFASVDLAPRGPVGSLTGTVTDAVGDDTISGATVTVVVDERPRSTRTGADGSYTFPAIPVGTWDATGSATGYRDSSDTVEIVEDETTTQDFSLSPLPSVSGTVTDANDELPIAGATVTATSGDESVETETADDGTYHMFIDLGTWTVTAEQDGYTTESGEVTAEEDGQELTLDLALRTGVASPDPAEIDAVLLSGEERTVELTLSNTGTADLTWEALQRGGGSVSGQLEWLERPSTTVTVDSNTTGQPEARPSAATWQPETPGPAQSDILIYADDAYHTAPNTHTDVALQNLGLGYTAFYNANFAGFEGALAEGGWDLVLFANDNFAPPASTFDALDDYVAGGGKLVAHSWQVGAQSTHPLWATLGVQWVSNDTEPPSPVFWWDPTHPVFTDPRSVPELTDLTGFRYGVYGQRVEPLEGFEALAGYTEEAAANEAALVLGNDDRTMFRGFADGQNDADLDDDDVLDGVELWMNLIVGIDEGFFADVPWLDVEPEAGTLAPGESEVLDVTIDTTDLEVGVYEAEITFVTDAARESRTPVPVRLVVTPYLQGANAGGDSYTSVDQEFWAADQEFDGAWGYVDGQAPSRAISTGRPIAGTDDDVLYQHARTGRGFDYRFDDLPDGVYELELHFAEIARRTPGRRLFDVTAGGTPLLVAYDIADDVGLDTAVAHRFTLQVDDGDLTVRFHVRNGFGQPVVNAVRLTHRPDVTD